MCYVNSKIGVNNSAEILEQRTAIIVSLIKFRAFVTKPLNAFLNRYKQYINRDNRQCAMFKTKKSHCEFSVLKSQKSR